MIVSMPATITPLPIMLEEEDQKIYDRLEPPKTIVVRFGYQKLVAELPYGGDAKPGCGSKLLIRTGRGDEIAEMLTTTCPNTGCGSAVSRKEMLQYIQNSGAKRYPFTTRGEVLRVATHDDLHQQARIDEMKPDMRADSREAIDRRGLPLKLVEVEPLLGGEHLYFYYKSDDPHLDLTDLSNEISEQYGGTRVEFIRVDDREEARLVADYERCGQRCCCKQFLKVLKPVNMKSAKVQKATLDPAKISGRCGRLMCCLRYEDQTYEELRKRLPHRKTLVETPDGVGQVWSTQILTQLVLVKIGSTAAAAYPVEDIRELDKDEARQWRNAQPKSDPSDRRREPRDEDGGDRRSAPRRGRGGPNRSD